jgi:hypothetical protein
MPGSHEQLAERVAESLAGLIASDLDALRKRLIRLVDAPDCDLVRFVNAAIAFWQEMLAIDRIFVCDMRDGTVVAGWNTGKNIVRLQDWDPRYRPLEDDVILQKALEGDEMVAAPIDGEGADLAFSLPLDDGRVWLLVFDDTARARTLSPSDMAWINLVRDLLVIKSRSVQPHLDRPVVEKG